MKPTRPLNPALLCNACLAAASAAGPVPVLFDTDMSSDCDDAGALAVLHALADLGEARILGVAVNAGNPSGASAAAVSAINTWYGRPDIPIGTDKDGCHPPAKRPDPTTSVRWTAPISSGPKSGSLSSWAAASPEPPRRGRFRRPHRMEARLAEEPSVRADQ